jgi:hypothetical protein
LTNRCGWENRLVNSSFGWKPTHKYAETFSKESRFLVLVGEPGTPDENELHGFVMFKFEGNDEGPSGEVENVLYW